MSESRSWPRLLIAVLLMCVLAAGCASTPGQADPDRDPDPLERINRPIHDFNMTADRWVLRPVAKGYDTITPDPMQRGIRNFFRNLGEPVTVVHGLLQGRPVDSGRSTVRFVLNSTVGILGFFDVASQVGLPRERRDLGQTLGKWGFASGPYIVVPFLGPSTIRDGTGRIGDWFIDPYSHQFEGRQGLRNQLLVLNILDTRANLLPLDDVLEQAFDPYTFMRDSYLQQRRAMVRNGDADSMDDFSRDDFDDLDDLDDYEDF